MNKTSIENVPEKEGYLYAVLNLSKEASETEINERHRSLSLIFHPDRQRVDSLKETASAEYLEIQKAFQVLSDPFLRQVYDTLGLQGLKVQWPAYIRSRPKDEIQKLLKYHEVELQREDLKRLILPKGKFTCSVDASPLFNWEAQSYASANDSWISRAWQSVSNTHSLERHITYNVEKKINDKTSLLFESLASGGETRASIQFVGTIRHQFSPRITTSASLNPLYPFRGNFEAQYEDSDNKLLFKTASLLSHPISLPLTTISFSRRLFRSRSQRGKIVLQVAENPAISFEYNSPPTITSAEGDALPQQGPPSMTGFKYMLLDKTFGITINQVFPNIFAEIGLSLVELSLRFKCSIQCGLTGILLNIGANWSNETAEVGSVVALNRTGVVLHLDLRYLEQQLSLPVVLSTEFSPYVALGAVVVPSCAAALGYHFIVIPRRRKQRLGYLRTTKTDLEENSDVRQRKIAVEELLKDPAKKQTRLEAEREGLIIQEATYGAAEVDDATENISLDVTIPLQALVRNSQLHIPGGDTKAALQGFLDPAPFASKVLRIHYLFHGRVHYAEIPDFLPVVLPLAEHKVSDVECSKTIQ